MWNSRVVILDEPTAALGVAQTQQVLELVKRLSEQALAVVLISHNLHDIFEVADRITVLRLGQNIAVYERQGTTQQEVVHAITAGVPTKVAGIRGREPERRRDDGRRAGDRCRPPSNALGAIVRRRFEALKAGDVGVIPDHHRPARHRRVLLLEERELPERRQLHQPDVQMAGVTTIAIGVVFVLLPRRDRPLDRLCVRHRGRGRRRAPGPGRELADEGHARDSDCRHRDRADRPGAGLVRRVHRDTVVRRHARRAAVLAGRDPLRDRRPGRDRDRGQHDQQRRELLLLRHRRPPDRRGSRSRSMPSRRCRGSSAGAGTGSTRTTCDRRRSSSRSSSSSCSARSSGRTTSGGFPLAFCS